jgi:hypothetical protein
MTSVTINIYGGEDRGAAPSRSFLTGPVISKGYIRSAEITMRNNRLGRVAMATMTTSARADPVVFQGIVSDFDGANYIPLVAEIQQDTLNNLGYTAIADDELRITWQGNDTQYRIVGYSLQEAIGGLYQIQSGVFVDDASGDETEFVASLDPLPAPVILVMVVAGIAALACIAGLVLSTALSALAVVAAIAACINAGGLPDYSLKTNLVPSYSAKNGLNFGCQIEVRITCNPKPAAAPGGAGGAPAPGGGPGTGTGSGGGTGTGVGVGGSVGVGVEVQPGGSSSGTTGAGGGTGGTGGTGTTGGSSGGSSGSGGRKRSNR